MRPAAPRRARGPARGVPGVGLPPRVDLGALLDGSALGDTDEIFRRLGTPADDGGRDVPALGGLLEGSGGGGPGEGTIGLGTIGRLDGRGPLAPTLPRRRLVAGPLIDCLTEMPCPRIERGAPDDATLLRRAVRQRRPALSHCYALGLAHPPTLRGALVVQLLVDRLGRVTPTVVESALASDGADVAACFTRVLATIELPARADLLVATYPFSLRPAAE